MSNNWVVGNLQNAIDTWNSKLNEIWTIISQSPSEFRGGTIWNAILNIHGAIQAFALALLVLFFAAGVVKTFGSFAEIKKPEQEVKLFIRFALSELLITHGLELMMNIFKIVQGIASTIMESIGFASSSQTALPSEIINAVESCGFFESIPLWAVTLIRRVIYNCISIYNDFVCIW